MTCARSGPSAESAVPAMLPRRVKIMLAAPFLALLAFAGLPARSADVLSPAAQRGFVLVRVNCARCHAISVVGNSPLKIAPPFRTLHEHYPVEDLEESLAEGIVTGHPTMPEFRFDPGQVADIISYLKSLER